MNAPFSDGAFAIFGGGAGTVTVDDSLGAVTVSGMQFATDGYLVARRPDHPRGRAAASCASATAPRPAPA